MFELQLVNGGKRYNAEWIFKGLDLTIKSGDSVVFLGGNGSGKSTTLRTLFGYAPLSSGGLEYRKDGKEVKQPEAYKFFSYCAPYLDLYEELTLNELANFHFRLKPILPELSDEKPADLFGLGRAADKQIKYFSSGMKQRVRLGLGIMSDSDVIFLDEPTVNLDREAIEWYGEIVEKYRGDRIILVASNRQEHEYFFCRQKIEIENYKPA